MSYDPVKPLSFVVSGEEKKVLCNHKQRKQNRQSLFKTELVFRFEQLKNTKKSAYVLKQGSPDMSCVVMTTCDKDKSSKIMASSGFTCFTRLQQTGAPCLSKNMHELNMFPETCLETQTCLAACLIQ